MKVGTSYVGKKYKRDSFLRRVFSILHPKVRLPLLVSIFVACTLSEVGHCVSLSLRVANRLSRLSVTTMEQGPRSGTD